MKFYFFIILFFFIVLSSKGQTSYERNPASAILFSNTLQFNNPSAISLEKDNYIFIGSQDRTGAWNEFESYYTQGAFKFHEHKIKYNAGYLGFSINVENEGSFIRFSDIMMSYCWKTKIRKNLFTAAALEMGVSSIFVEGTILTGNSSDRAFNVNTGIILSDNKFTVGISVKQIKSSSLTPYKQNIKMSPCYIFHLSYKYNINEKVYIKPTTLYKIKRNLKDEFKNNIEITLGKHFASNIGYLMKTGMYYSASINNIKVKDQSLDFYISYLVPTNFSSTKVSIYEFIMKYNF